MDYAKTKTFAAAAYARAYFAYAPALTFLLTLI